MVDQAVNQNAGDWGEWEAGAYRKCDAASTAQISPKSSDLSRDYRSAKDQPFSSLFFLPPPCGPAPAAPQGATLSGICVDLAASLRLVFFFCSCWEDLNELSS